MRLKTHHKLPIIIFTLLLLLVGLLMFIRQKLPRDNIAKLERVEVVATPTPSIFTTYTPKTVAKSKRYDIYLIGDSMMNAFGPRGGRFNEALSQAHPDEFFEIVNYGQAGQNIEMLPERLNQEVQADYDLLLQPIIEGDPELIIIESYGYNPLSHLGLTPGLQKQTEILRQVMTTLTRKFPNTAIMFMATIAPDKNTYGMKVTQSDAAGRAQQAEERMEYIRNHIKFAQEHNIPVINAFDESLDAQGNGNPRYINPDDNIHPSDEGLLFMADLMKKRIEEEKIFPLEITL